MPTCERVNVVSTENWSVLQVHSRCTWTQVHLKCSWGSTANPPIVLVYTKQIGVHIHGNLSWECHINEISKKIASDISVIKRIRYFLPFEILLNVCNSLIQPHLDYCNVVWGNCSTNLSSKLQKLQNRAALILTFSNYDSNTGELFQNLKWSKLVHQRVVSKAIMVRRCDLTSYNLRENEYKLAVPQPRAEFNKRSLSYSGSMLWNLWNCFWRCGNWHPLLYLGEN